MLRQAIVAVTLLSMAVVQFGCTTLKTFSKADLAEADQSRPMGGITEVRLNEGIVGAILYNRTMVHFDSSGGEIDSTGRFLSGTDIAGDPVMLNMRAVRELVQDRDCRIKFDQHKGKLLPDEGVIRGMTNTGHDAEIAVDDVALLRAKRVNVLLTVLVLAGVAAMVYGISTACVCPDMSGMFDDAEWF